MERLLLLITITPIRLLQLMVVTMPRLGSNQLGFQDAPSRSIHCDALGQSFGSTLQSVAYPDFRNFPVARRILLPFRPWGLDGVFSRLPLLLYMANVPHCHARIIPQLLQCHFSRVEA